MLAFFAASALAATFVPDAVPSPGFEFGAGPAMLLRSTPLPGGHVYARGEVGQWAFSGVSTGFVGPDCWAQVGARWLLLDKPGFHLAPFLVAADHAGPSSLDHRLAARLGLAVEGGWEHLRLDLSLPLFGVQYFWDPSVETQLSLLSPLEAVLPLEGGVAWRFDDHHAVRLGLLGILPAVGWETRMERWTVHAVAASMGANSLFLARVGVRLGGGGATGGG